MLHVIIVAIGIFTNSTTGEHAQAIARVASVQQCAELINDNREPKQAQDGTMWYLTSAECRAVQTK